MSRRRVTKIPLASGPAHPPRVISLKRSADIHAYLWIGEEPAPGSQYGRCFGTLDMRGMRRLHRAIGDALGARAERIMERKARSGRRAGRGTKP